MTIKSIVVLITTIALSGWLNRGMAQSGLGGGDCPSQSASTISASATSICAGTQVTFTPTNYGNLGTGVVYTWNWLLNGETVQNTTTSTFKSSTLHNGDRIQCEVIIDPDKSGCSNYSNPSNTITMTVTTLGVPTAPSGSTTLCQASAPTAYTTSSTGATSYTWSISPSSAGTISGTGMTGTVTWNSAYNGLLSIKVAANGCGGPATSPSINVTVTPTVGTPSAPSGSTTVCQGSAPVAYTTSATNATSYNWSISPSTAGTISGTGTTGTVTWNSSFAGTSTVSVSANGCNGPSSAATSVTVLPPVGTPSVPVGSATVYSGGSATYTTSATGATSYTWTLNGTVVSGTGASNTITFPLGMATQATIGVSANGCGGPSAAATSTVMVMPDINFIRTRDIIRPGITDTVTADGLTATTDVHQSTEYFDGLGRPIQEVAMQASPLQHDMVDMSVYDDLGREATHYLPYTSALIDGNYKINPTVEQTSFNTAQFPGEQYYYGSTAFEASPLNRTSAVYAAGLNWQGASRGVADQYSVNATSDSVQDWVIASAPESLPVSTGLYAVGALYKNITTDEQGHQVVQYSDLQGHILLKKVQLWPSPAAGPSGWLNTYYVYDTLTNLRFVIPPAGVQWLQSNGWSFAASGGAQMASNLCFRYEYDYRRRMIIRKVPGAGEVWMVYDVRDRLVMTQDSNMRVLGKWLTNQYDVENRPDSTGLLTDPNNRGYHQNLAANSADYPATTGGNYEWLTGTYYDNYSWVTPATSQLNYIGDNVGTSNFITSYNTSPLYALPLTVFYNTRGMTTGHMKKVIGTTSTYLYSNIFYDDHSREVQTQSINYSGGVDTLTTQSDFSGKPLRVQLDHKDNDNSGQDYLVVTKMSYDPEFRLKSIYKNINNAASDQLIDSMQYNELGQLRAKYLGNTVDSLVYAYNVRGWLTGINPKYVAGSGTNYFGMELGYDKTASVAPGNTYTTPEYNGNIEGTVWKTAGSGINRKYDFSYDGVNRLAGANFTQYNGSGFDQSAGINFSVSGLNYDANGNILNMTQTGFKVGGSTPIDILTYSYGNGGVSNQLAGVVDAANVDTTLLGDFHYNPATKQSTDYAYDGNGNLHSDNNKAIDSIGYNYLNLPQYVHMKGKGIIVYTYDANGTKWKKTITDSLVKHSTTVLYLGNFIYQQVDSITNADGGIDTLQFMSHEEGRARWAFQKFTTGTTGYSFQYDFFEKDHLGNTRMVLTQERDTTNYLASMEAAYRSTESQIFGNIASTCVAWSSVPNYQNISSSAMTAITNPNDSVSKVDYTGSGGQTTGPSLLLKVMSGDTVTMGVQSYYNSNTVNTTNSSFTSVLNSLASGLLGTPAGDAEGGLSGYTSSTSPVYGALISFLGTYDQAPPAGYPKAYLNWIFLDDQFNYVSSASNSVQAASATYPAGQLNSVAPGGPVVMPRNGYLYVWVSNETQGWDVFFDNLSVQYKQGPILEENHYYPYGLTMAGISDKALKTNYGENKYRFGGKELQHQEFSDGSGLEEYDFGNRMQDPQLGRWWRIDPLSEFDRKWSPYNYAKDNPVRFLDPDGMWAEDANGDYTTTDVNEIKSFINSDPGQRKKAIAKAKEYVDKKADGNQYELGAKGKPGEKVDCSGVVGACVVAGGEPDPNHGDGGSGVVNIQNNTTKLKDKDVVAGNIVTFYFDEGYPYHTGILIDVVKDKDGKITSFTMIQSSSGKGPNETTVTVGEGKLGNNIAGYYKWDTKPDPPSTSNSNNNSEYNRLIQIANYADKKGLKNTATYYRNEAEKVKSN